MTAAAILTQTPKHRKKRPRTRAEVRENVFAMVQELADSGVRLTSAEFRARHDHARLEQIKMLDWVTIDVNREGMLFIVDVELRDYLAKRLMRPQLAPLAEEIRRRRDEHRHWRDETQWVTRVAELIRLTDLLNYIEEELAKVADHYAYLRPVRAKLHSRREEYWKAQNKPNWLAHSGNLEEHGKILDWLEDALSRLLIN